MHREPFLALLRTCQSAGAAAVVFTASPSPLPLFSNLARDAADIRLVSVALTAHDLELCAAACAGGAMGTLGDAASSREEMEERALPLLRGLMREGKGGLGLGRVMRRLGGDARQLVDPSGLRILCLDGGGIRGLVRPHLSCILDHWCSLSLVLTV